MAESPVHFRSDTNEWPTPRALFDVLNAEFGFTLDVCATPANAKCARFYTKADDGLAQDWAGVCWMNPPFGHPIKLWMEKALRASCHGATVVCLVPARTDTRWWHRYAMRADEIRALDKRLQFIGGAAKAPFPAVVVIFRPKPVGTQRQPVTLTAMAVPDETGGV